jgi:excinuclease ABC subunit B
MESLKLPPLKQPKRREYAERKNEHGGMKPYRDDPPPPAHKPHLDKMHGPESLPYRPNRATPSRDDADAGSGSKIFQPTDSRQSGPEFGPAPRSSGGAPGHRGGWKKR